MPDDLLARAIADANQGLHEERSPAVALDKALAAAMLVAFAAPSPFGHAAFLWAALGLTLLTAAAGSRRCWPVAHLGSALTVAAYLLSFRSLRETPPTAIVMAVAVYWIAARLIPALRASVEWAHVGRSGRAEWSLAAKYALAATASVAIWFFLLLPGTYRLPPLPKSYFAWHASLGLLAVGVAAAAEEILFRGVMLTSLDELFGDGILPLTMQAAVYAAAMWRTSNPGWVYAPLAFAFGLMLGAIRRRTNGLYIPWMAHFIADAVVYVLLLWRAGP